ncbi:uncharacterized protein RCC_09855 [Ramularia collo-cygni]|uniref:Ribosomal RNA methyltransferase FtsJ domain-containing protein n=1 Tax=Ramularia collo-cygni TaxID=112498 RepID=A0A2D3VQ16_9PEZI|nr:uncharacterized protein RCC_09855 [Ramularia collo-cygni]CZT24138.1 uncharacterized protein RCC_09855 [Ramularia collo-cygni]
MAPGGFLSIALRRNAGSRALAFTLPTSDGGHKVLLPSTENVQVRFIDITMFAADMGVTNVPNDHEEAHNFLPRAFTQDKRMFDLAICDAQVLRTHARASYREAREASRLTTTQLALGLGNLKEGGTMSVLLHKVEAWRTVRLLHQFSKFSNVRLFKPLKAHTTRSSFYMVASHIRPLHIEAVRATEEWRRTWKLATFGT